MKFVALLVVLAFAAVCANEYQTIKTPTATFYSHHPANWIRKERASPDHELGITFAVKLRNTDKLEQILLDISNPESPNFLKHMTFEEVGALTADWDNVFVVLSWLASNNIPAKQIQVLPNGDFIRVRLSVAEAEAMFESHFFNFKHIKTGVELVRTELYKLPKHVDDVVDFVGALHHAPAMNSRMPAQKLDRSSLMTSNEVGSIPSGYIGPSTLLNYYGIDNYEVSSGSKSTAAVFEDGQDFSPSDLSSFQSKYGVKSNPIYNVVGPNTSWMCLFNKNACGEGSLDIQYLGAIAQGAKISWWAVTSSDQTPFVDWINQVAAASDAPLVHSISYGAEEGQISQSVAQRFDQEVQKLGARGISVMVSSGDDGVAGAGARSDSSKCGFNPSYPATSTYVTAVGATQGTENNQPETACRSNAGGLITTGGGFSTFFSRPSYQDSVVSAYLANGPKLPPTSNFASGGRGYPDVSMAGHNYIIIVGGSELVVSGTSASSPVFAGVITLINDARMSQGKQPLGFLNQILYNLAASTPSAYKDVTEGTNNCCAGQSSPVCCKYGFTATSGWDPLTGLGSVNFPVFSQALIDL